MDKVVKGIFKELFAYRKKRNSNFWQDQKMGVFKTKL